MLKEQKKKYYGFFCLLLPVQTTECHVCNHTRSYRVGPVRDFLSLFRQFLRPAPIIWLARVGPRSRFWHTALEAFILGFCQSLYRVSYELLQSTSTSQFGYKASHNSRVAVRSMFSANLQSWDA
ncbi:hypothetical protein TMatcc_000054 [Talaromyces marneffei ATCC 18224]